MTKDKRGNHSRGRASKIDLLPKPIQDALHALLRSKKHTQLDIVDAVNDLIEAEGLDDDLKLSRSGLNRYASRMEGVGARIREARAVSEQWINQLGTTPEGDVSKILIEMVRTIAFDSVMKMSAEDEPMHPKLIKDLAIGIEKLEKAASENQKRDFEIRKQMATEAAEAVDTVAREQGLSPETIAMITNKILGVV